MRVAFDVGPVRDKPTGVGVFAAAMATALASALDPAQLVLMGRRRDSRGLPEQTHSIPLDGGSYVRWIQTRAARDVKRAGADIGHFSDGLAPFIRHGRTVVSIHDLSVVRMWRTHPARRLLRVPFAIIAPHLADLVLVPSRATADEVMRLTATKASKIEVMPYGPQHQTGRANDAAISAAAARYGLSRHGYVLALGTIEPRKNHVRLVEAFEMLVRSGAIAGDVLLVIAGGAGWHAGPIIDRFAGSSAASRIRQLGYVPAEDLGPLLSGAAVVAFPSLYEGFGLPVLEAMACGAPTVTSNISSMPEVAGGAAFLVNPFDASDIARGLEEALHAASHDPIAVASASVTQAAKFTWQRAADTALQMYTARLQG